MCTYRFARIAKYMSRIPELQMILQGLNEGFMYNMHIFFLLFLTFYIFAIIGMSLFQSNDPWSFGNVFISMFTMLRVATLEVSVACCLCVYDIVYAYYQCTYVYIIHCMYMLYCIHRVYQHKHFILYIIQYSDMYIPYTIYYT